MRITVLFLLILAACADTTAERAGPAVSLVLDEPYWEAGAGDELERPASATLLPNGNVAVADVFAANIKFFDPRGALIRTIGRKGGGPGEYQNPNWIAQCERDRLYVFDGGAFRMSVLDTAGTLIRHFTSEHMMTGGLSCAHHGGGEHVYFITPHGPNRLDEPGARPQRMLADLGIFNDKGEERRRIADLLMWEGLGPPITKRGSVSVGRDIIWYGNADSAYIDKFSMRGKRLGAVAVGFEPRRVEPEHVQAIIERAVSMFPAEADREVARRIFAKYPTPAVYPVYSGVKADVHDNVWVWRSYPGEDSTMMRVIDADGVILGDVVIRRPLSVHEIGADYVLGSYEHDGQPRVAAFRVRFNAL